jgi:sulfur-oxidizing protein SoxY
MQRRDCLKIVLSLCAAVPFAHAFAARLGFGSVAYDVVVRQLLGGMQSLDSELLQLELPDIAENGADVLLTIRSELSGIERLHVLVEKNPTPLAASFQLTPELLPVIGMRIKMAESCMVVVYALHQQRWLKVQRWVNVLVGGCGSG